MMPPNPDFSTGISVYHDTTPDEVGNKIVALPFRAMCSELWGYGVFQGTSVSLRLYDSAGAVIASVSRDTDAIAGGHVLWRAPLPSPVLLTPDTNYRVTVRPDDGGGQVVDLGIVTVESGYNAAIPYCLQGAQPTIHRTERTDGGSWTDNYDGLVACGLVLSAIDTGDAAPAGWTPQGQSVGTPPPIVLPT
jgi:hypothetical protein